MTDCDTIRISGDNRNEMIGFNECTSGEYAHYELNQEAGNHPDECTCTSDTRFSSRSFGASYAKPAELEVIF